MARIVPKMKNAADVLKYYKDRTTFDKVLQQVNVTFAGRGRCSAELKISEEHVNPMGFLHTGLTATLVDCVSAYALMTKIPFNHVSVEIHVDFMNKARKGDEILIEGSVNRTGKTMAFLELEIRNKATGDLLVKGTHTKYILES